MDSTYNSASIDKELISAINTYQKGKAASWHWYYKVRLWSSNQMPRLVDSQEILLSNGFYWVLKYLSKDSFLKNDFVHNRQAYCFSNKCVHLWSILCRENKNKNFHLNIFSCQILSFHYMWRILYRECIDKVFLLNVLMHVSLNFHPVWKIFYIEYMDKLPFCVKDCIQRVQR